MTGVVEFHRGVGGKPDFNEHTDWTTITSASSLVHNGPCRIGAIYFGQTTASAGTRMACVVYDGSSSDGTVLFNFSAASSWAPDTLMNLPYPMLSTGLFVDWAGETTGVTGVKIFYLKDAR